MAHRRVSVKLTCSADAAGWLVEEFEAVSLYASQISLSFPFVLFVDMNVTQNVKVSAHFQHVCFSSLVISCQKFKLAGPDFSKLARA